MHFTYQTRNKSKKEKEKEKRNLWNIETNPNDELTIDHSLLIAYYVKFCREMFFLCPFFACSSLIPVMASRFICIIFMSSSSDHSSQITVHMQAFIKSFYIILLSFRWYKCDYYHVICLLCNLVSQSLQWNAKLYFFLLYALGSWVVWNQTRFLLLSSFHMQFLISTNPSNRFWI